MKKVLLTGHRGFIGTYLDMNLTDEYKVVGYDLRCGQDIRDRRKLDQTFEMEQPDIVIHCAALAGVRRGNTYPEDYISTNIVGTNNLIELSEKYDVSHFVNFSSSSVFGVSGYSHEPLNENSHKAPRSIYGVTKLAGEHIVNNSKIPTTIIRPFTVYGEHGRADQVIVKWINAIKADKSFTMYKNKEGTPSRGFTYVGDLVDGIKRVIKRDLDTIHTSYNLGGDISVNLQDLLLLFQQVTREKKKPYVVEMHPLPDTDQMGNQADTTKARNELDWRALTPFDDKVLQILRTEL